MQPGRVYAPLSPVTDPVKADELRNAIYEVNYEFSRSRHFVTATRTGLTYAQAIVDEVFGRRMPHRGYRVVARLENRMVVLDIEEPVQNCDVDHL